MPVEAQIEELRAERNAATTKREIRQIERELRALIARYAALKTAPG